MYHGTMDRNSTTADLENENFCLRIVSLIVTLQQAVHFHLLSLLYVQGRIHIMQMQQSLGNNVYSREMEGGT